MQTGRVGQNGSMRRPGPERGLGGVSPSPLVARAKGRILPWISSSKTVFHTLNGLRQGRTVAGKPSQCPAGLQGRD